MSLCINCGIATNRCNTIGRRRLEDEMILSIVQGWVAPQTEKENDFICQACWNHADAVSLDGNRREGSEQTPTSQCFKCCLSLVGCKQIEHPGISIQARQDISHLEEPPTRVETYSASRVATVGTLFVLSDYYRAVETESRCFVEGCQRRERNQITITMRKQLLKTYNYYVPWTQPGC